jgi:L-threonylcarbamoyladenylate synthase
MLAEVVVGDPAQPDPPVVSRAAQALADGQLVILPTETVYGLACRADDERALRRLLEVKHRSPQQALALILPDVTALPQVAEVSAAAQQLAAAFMPGPLTLVMRKTAAVSEQVTGGRETVGVRVPDLPLTQAILAACGFPVVATSANLAGEPPATQVAELAKELREAVNLIVDGGPCTGGEASTVVDVTVEPPVVLRTGPVTERNIQAVLGHCR